MQFFAVLSMLAVVRASEVDVTPVQKVLQLLGGMLEKGKKEKNDEQVLFAATTQYCGDQESVHSNAIKEEDQAISGLTATISKASADVSSLAKKVTALQKDENTWTGDKKAAIAVRKIEKADYDQTHKDYSESIDALSRAIAVLKKQTHDRQQSQGSSLVQVHPAVSSLLDLGLVSATSKKALRTFLQQGEEESALEGSLDAPEANGYEFQASGIVDMLAKLQDKFLDERTTLEKEEANSKHSHGMLIQDLDAQVTQGQADETAKSINKASRLQVKADATGDRKEEITLNTVDTKSLSDLKSSCAMKTADFEARQHLRSEEIQEIEKSVQIISGASVSGNAQKHGPALMQIHQKKATSLGQLRSSSNTQIQDSVVKFLQGRSKALNSRILAVIAQRASADPFLKVRKMINDLVVRLMEEANEESSHKGWCDTELATNAQTREEYSSGVETLHASIDELSASISKITDNVGDLSKAVANISEALATATKMRMAEKAQNTEAITDAQDAQTALAQAITVLKEFFAKAGEATSLIQQPYKGMQEENGGVSGMLEVLESDFARLEADTKAHEATSQKEYDTFATDSKTEKASKDTAIEHQNAKKQDESQALTTKKTDLEETQNSLDKALTYYDKLKPSCVDSGVSYEDRVQRRKEEIESLQEALKVMNGEDLS